MRIAFVGPPQSGKSTLFSLILGHETPDAGKVELLPYVKAGHLPQENIPVGDETVLARVLPGCDAVMHLAGYIEVAESQRDPGAYFENNASKPLVMLRAMVDHGIGALVFSSTAAVYGVPESVPIVEDAPTVPVNAYGASKLAAEGLIQAYYEGFDFQSYIFRFVSILGERYSHGHVYDFYASLRTNPDELKVLGDGRQRKSYLYVQDCIAAILLVIEKSPEKVNIFNLGTDEYCEVKESIGWISESLGLHPRLNFTGGERGWIGDSPFIFLDCSKVRALGWKPKLTIREGVLRTLSYLRENSWLMKERS